MGMLSFFPWISIREAISVGEYTLVPYRRGVAPGGKIQPAIDELLLPYWLRRAEPITSAVMLAHAGAELTADLDQESIDRAFDFAELVSAAGLAGRDFFHHQYCNRDSFRFSVQRFETPVLGVSIQTRRRDGSEWTFTPLDKYVVSKPDHVPARSPVLIDEPLLHCLSALPSTPDWPRFLDAIQNFNLASTDAPSVPMQVEVVLLTSALERILGSRSGNEGELRTRFMSLISPERNVAPSACARVTERSGWQTQIGGVQSIRELWIRDLFRLRGFHAHGVLDAAYPSFWSAREHSLLGAFIFPLVLKAVLHAQGSLDLTDKDRAHIDAFEILASLDHFAQTVHRPGDAAWNQVIRDASVSVRVRRWLRERGQAQNPAQSGAPQRGNDGG